MLGLGRLGSGSSPRLKIPAPRGSLAKQRWQLPQSSRGSCSRILAVSRPGLGRLSRPVATSDAFEGGSGVKNSLQCPVSSNLPRKGDERQLDWVTGLLAAWKHSQAHRHSQTQCSRCKGPRALWSLGVTCRCVVFAAGFVTASDLMRWHRCSHPAGAGPTNGRLLVPRRQQRCIEPWGCAV